MFGFSGIEKSEREKKSETLDSERSPLMFKRLWNLLTGILSSTLRLFEAANPKALIEAEKINLRNQLARFNQGLAEQAGHVYRLSHQAQECCDQEQKLITRIRALLKAGEQSQAARLALQLSTLQREINDLRTRCRVAEETYQGLEKARDRAVTDANARLEKLEQMVSQTEIITAQNELIEMAGKLNLSLGSAHQSIDAASETIEKTHQLALGRARVVRGEVGRQLQDLAAGEAERKFLEERALAEFLAVNDLVVPLDRPKQPSILPVRVETR